MTNDDEKFIPEGAIVRVTGSRKQKPAEKTRVEAALGNMRTHLWLDREKPVWTTVDKQDLEVILEYVNRLKLAPAETLEEFAEFIENPKEGGLDEHTLQEVALEARHQAHKLRTGE